MRIEDSIYRYGSLLQNTHKIRSQSESKANENSNVQKQSFEDLLSQKMSSELTFSKHAMQRLKTREIELSQDDLSRLDSAVQKAKTKGVENTLILSEKGAFIINVSSHVVITAMDQKDMKENIFTQIDGAVVI